MAQTGEMTFWDHLEELRGSLFRMLAVFGVAVVVLFFFKDFLFGGGLSGGKGKDKQISNWQEA